MCVHTRVSMLVVSLIKAEAFPGNQASLKGPHHLSMCLLIWKIHSEVKSCVCVCVCVAVCECMCVRVGFIRAQWRENMNYREPSRVLTIRFGFSHANLFLNGFCRSSLFLFSHVSLSTSSSVPVIWPLMTWLCCWCVAMADVYCWIFFFIKRSRRETSGTDVSEAQRDRE